VALRGHLAPHLGDSALRVYEKGLPQHPLVLLPVKVLLPPGPVGQDGLALGVGEEGKVEAVLLGEALVARHVVGGNPKDHGPQSLQVPHAVPEAAGLLGATGGVVLGVEVEDHPPPPVVRKAVDPALLVGKGEVWS
jgi:hypothetical protein